MRHLPVRVPSPRSVTRASSGNGVQTRRPEATTHAPHTTCTWACGLCPNGHRAWPSERAQPLRLADQGEKNRANEKEEARAVYLAKGRRCDGCGSRISAVMWISTEGGGAGEGVSGCGRGDADTETGSRERARGEACVDADAETGSRERARGEAVCEMGSRERARGVRRCVREVRELERWEASLMSQ
ncbi:hypothetical protein Cni_G21762 [Canna indica]|uniref:Uncharacterized protein n=1 Tax=Canna indica TaxID=4628 RepID=A0AAQ3KQ48_9LILI|nr:hypothetical protein Cni_G21762 [Canna indica]